MLTLKAVGDNLAAYICWNRCPIWKVAQIHIEQMCVPLQLVPGLVERELCDLWNGVPTFEQPAGRFVPQVMECQIYDSEYFACPCEGVPILCGL